MHKTPQKMRKVIFIVVAFNAFCGDLKKNEGVIAFTN